MINNIFALVCSTTNEIQIILPVFGTAPLSATLHTLLYITHWHWSQDTIHYFKNPADKTKILQQYWIQVIAVKEVAQINNWGV